MSLMPSVITYNFKLVFEQIILEKQCHLSKISHLLVDVPLKFYNLSIKQYIFPLICGIFIVGCFAKQYISYKYYQYNVYDKFLLASWCTFIK